MRKALGAAVLALAAAVTSASAQGTVGFMGRATPNLPIRNVPIDTSLSVVPTSALQPRHLDFGVSNFFSNLHMPSFPSLIGQSPLPAPSSFPSTQYPNKLQPVQPIIPGQ